MIQGTLQTLLSDYHQPWLVELESRIVTTLETLDLQHTTWCDTAEVVRSTSFLLGSELNAVSIRTHLELMRERGESIDTYHQWATEISGRNYIREHYPELNRILDYKVEQLASLVLTVILRFDQDLPSLMQRGFRVDRQLLGMEITNGDPHQGGQRVCILNTGFDRIVFKPRSLLIDQVLAETATIINPMIPQAAQIRLPEVLDCGDYGWQEFIPYERAHNLTELAQYYQSLGSLTAFFAAVGGQDLHYENLTTRRNQAIPLDLEAGLGSVYQIRKLMGTDLVSRINQTASTAGSRTMILPPLMRSERFDIDLSPITDGSAQQSATMQAPSLNYHPSGTLELHMEGSWINKAVPAPINSDPEQTHPRRFLADFELGYSWTSQKINEAKPKLTAYFQNVGAIPNRCIIRPTSTYAAFLDTSYHPQYLVSREQRAQLFSRLGRPPGVPESLGQQAGTKEQQDLMAGDIPYFTDTDLQVLANQLKSAIPDVDNSALKHVQDFKVAPIQALEAFWTPSPAAVRMVHHGTFAGLDENVWNERGAEEMPDLFVLDFSDGFSAVQHQLAQQLLELLIWDEEQTRASLLYQRIGADHRVQVAPLDFTYYDGQGVLKTLEAVHHSTNDERFRKALVGLLTTCVEEPPVIGGAQQISGWIDGFSQLRLVPMIQEYLGQDQAIEYARCILEGALERLRGISNTAGSTGTELNTDYVTGLAGALELVATVELPEAVSAQALRCRLEEQLITLLKRIEPESGTHGIAHGSLGPVMVLAEVGMRQLGQADLIELAEQLYCFEIDTITELKPAARQAWCNGIPGVLEAYVRINQASSDGATTATLHAEVFKHWEQTRADLLGFKGKTDISRCHGLAGTLGTWQRIAQRIAAPALESEIRHLAELLRTRLATGELQYTGGTRHGGSQLGHLLGLTGALNDLSQVSSTQAVHDAGLRKRISVS